MPWEVFHDQERAAMFRFHGKRAFVGHMAGTRRIMIMMNDPSLTREEDTPFDAGYTALAAQAQAQAGLGAGARAGARVEWRRLPGVEAAVCCSDLPPSRGMIAESALLTPYSRW